MDSSNSSEFINADTVQTIESNHSSEVDELKELEMRTGLVKNKVSTMRIPSLKHQNSSAKKVSKKRTLTFADSVMTSKKGGQSVCS